MIEVASNPSPLSGWEQQSGSLYLELMGETSPVVDEGYSVVSGPAAGVDGPIYEYWWSLGHPGEDAEADHWWHHGEGKVRRPWEALDDPAARVYVYFPTDHGWRAKEGATSVKYLAPAREQESLMAKAESDFAKVQPALAAAGDLTAKLGGLPEVGTAAKAAAAALGAAAKVKVASVPPAAGYAWSVAKVATTFSGEFVQGVMWTLPRKIFTELGGRITGSVSVSLIAAGRQDGTVQAIPTLGPAPMLARAVVCHGGETMPVPESGFVKLLVAPRLGSSPA